MELRGYDRTNGAVRVGRNSSPAPPDPSRRPTAGPGTHAATAFRVPALGTSVNPRIPRSFGSGFLLAGAFAIGWVLHQVFVLETMPITAPVAVFVSLAGLGFIALGRRLEREFDPSMFVPADAEDDEDEFDEELSPLDAEDLDRYDADEDYRP